MFKKVMILCITGFLFQEAFTSEKKHDAKDAEITTKISTGINDHGELQKIVTTTYNFKPCKLITTYTYKKDNSPYSVYMNFMHESVEDKIALISAQLLSIETHMHSIVNNSQVSKLLN